MIMDLLGFVLGCGGCSGNNGFWCGSSWSSQGGRGLWSRWHLWWKLGVVGCGCSWATVVLFLSWWLCFVLRSQWLL